MAEEEIVQQETGKPVPDIGDYDGEPADTDIPEASEDARTVISIKGLKKSYWIVEPFKTDKGKIKLRKKVEYPVFDGIDLEVKEGDIVAVLGRNGCGKSTFLKIVSGIVEPDGGTVEVKGKVASILELSMGFHGDLSGRDNIILRSQFYGIPRKYVLEHLDEIIEYTDLGVFIDNPVRTYSSGMRSRLAFSVMVNVNADIFLIDEALSTGDMAFSSKASEHLKELVRSGKTVLFTSHSMGSIKRTCNRAIWIDNRRIAMDGPADQVVDAYSRSITESLEETMNLAKGGSSTAQYRLATFYRDGTGVDKDPEEYRRWLEQAAFREHPMAMAELADILVSEGDTEAAMDLYRRAAESGDFDSRRKYSVMFGETHREVEVLRGVMKELAESGYPYDLYNYGNLLYRSALIPSDYDEAFVYVSKASEAGWTEADFLLAQMYRDGTGTERSVQRAEELFQKAADAGHQRAMIVLADMYLEGKYVPMDTEKAFALYLRSAQCGNLRSQYQVATMLSEGIGTERDPEASKQWFARYASTSLNDFRRTAMDALRSRSESREVSIDLLKSSSRSLNTQAMMALSSKYADGRDVKKNKEAAFQLMERAAVAGGSARARLGLMYLEGEGVEKDTSKAFQLFRSAAEYGDGAGMYQLALMYKDGISCEENQANYRMYMRMAAERGNRDAKQIVIKWDDRIKRRKAKKEDQEKS